MTVAQLSTPCLLVEKSRLDANLRRMQTKADENKVQLRPHIKTHKSLALASRQGQLGAHGITVAKPSEAEVFAQAGFEDIRLAYTVVGPDKHARLLRLMENSRISFCVDTSDGARAASKFYAAHKTQAEVLLEVDVGYGRCGLPWDRPESVEFAQYVESLPGLQLTGILTHAGHSYHKTEIDALKRVAMQERDRMLEFAGRLQKAGMTGPASNRPLEISIGSTPSIAFFENRQQNGLSISEIRPGTYIFNDRTEVALKAAKMEDCALTVLSTVVSKHPHASGERIILDAGKKILTAEVRNDLAGYGVLLKDAQRMQSMANAQIVSLSEEHGWVVIDGASTLNVGDRVRILPNHVCVVVNTQDYFRIVDGENVVESVRVDARGCVQ